MKTDDVLWAEFFPCMFPYLAYVDIISIIIVFLFF